MIKECITHMFCSYEKYDLNVFKNMIKSMHTHIRKKYGELPVKHFWSMSYPTWLKLQKWYPGLCGTEFYYYKDKPSEKYFIEIDVCINPDLSDDIVNLIAKEKVNYMEKFYVGGTHRGGVMGDTVDMYKKQVNSIYGMPPHFLLAGMTKNHKLAIKEVIYNKPATIIYWKDGDKTVVKCGDDEAYDKEKGFVMAVIKHLLGNKGNYYNEIKKWVPYEPEAEKDFEELTVKEYAEKHNMGESTVRHKLAKGEILGVKDKHRHWVIAD